MHMICNSPRIACGAQRGGRGLIVLFILSLCALSIASAQETEPNNACQEAQVIGSIALPHSVNGSLDTPPEVPDVDFFRFAAPPGTEFLVADLEGQATNQGTLPDPFLGLFDSNCNLLAVNDDFQSLNARLLFAVPTEGVFILAAASCCDGGFSGNGGSSGSYRLTVGLPPPAIGSISGRLIDAVSGQPLRGDQSPLASVTLQRCTAESCFETVAYQSTDSAGEFRFTLDYAGTPLAVGTYQVQSFASEYESAQTDPFAVGEGEDFDVGDIALQPPPVRFSEIRPCGDLPPEGGLCLYSVRVTNTSAARLQGQAWSLVNGFGIGSRLGYTSFQAIGLGYMNLQPGQSRVARFVFRVPARVSDGAGICTQVYFGQGREPYFDTLAGGVPLFCILKGFTGGFTVLSEKESLRLLRDPNNGRPPLKLGQ
jgi:hypothetical protein